MVLIYDSDKNAESLQRSKVATGLWQNKTLQKATVMRRVSPAASPEFSCEKTNCQKQEEEEEKGGSLSPCCGSAQASTELEHGGLVWKSSMGCGALGEVQILCGMLAK